MGIEDGNLDRRSEKHQEDSSSQQQVEIDVVSTVDYDQVKTPKQEKQEELLTRNYCIEEAKGVVLEWKNLKFSTPVVDSKTKETVTKHILKDISGVANPGELLIIMGPSGAGKSSLMDCLAGRNKQFTGTVSMDQTPWSKDLVKLTSYVIQDDLFFENLTVMEHLTFQAALRMGGIEPERKQRVVDLLSELGLTKCKDSKIGGTAGIRGISGGERKRLAFASELLTNPRILFADEPTSGLDSVMAETVLLQLQQLAHQGRTVLATIHQPSSELYPLFDRLLLVADGNVVYHGAASRAVEYFGTVGLQCPSYSNPTDFFMRQLSLSENDEGISRKRVDDLVVAWGNKRNEYAVLPPEDAVPRKKEELFSCIAQHRRSYLNGFCVLAKRNWLRNIRDDVAFKARLGQALFLGIIVGLIYLQLGNNDNAPQNFSGALFFIAVNQVFSAATPEFIGIPLELPIFSREHKGGLYRSLAYYMAKTVSEIPIQLFMPWFFIIPAYFMVGFGASAALFFKFVGIVLLISNCASALGYFISCLTGNAKVASILGPMIILPFLLFGGLFLNDNNAPKYLIWLQYTSPIKYGFEMLMAVFWDYYGDIDCSSGVNCQTGEQVLHSYSLSYSHITRNIFALLALNVGWRILAFIILAYRHRKT